MPHLARKHCIKTGNYSFTEKTIYTYFLSSIKKQLDKLLFEVGEKKDF